MLGSVWFKRAQLFSIVNKFVSHFVKWLDKMEWTRHLENEIGCGNTWESLLETRIMVTYGVTIVELLGFDGSCLYCSARWWISQQLKASSDVALWKVSSTCEVCQLKKSCKVGGLMKYSSLMTWESYWKKCHVNHQHLDS